MNNIKLLKKGISEIIHLDKRVFFCTILLGLTVSLNPFINIWYTSKIIQILSLDFNISKISLIISKALCMNFIFFFTKTFLNDMYPAYRSQMYNKEQYNISHKLFSEEYSHLETNEFNELIHKHNESQKRTFSAFFQLSNMLQDFISSLTTILVSIIILYPLFKIGFVKTRNSFFEKPIFLLSLLLLIFSMLIIILIIATKINKNQFKTIDEYSKIDRIFYYFVNVFKNHNIGKEIRLYEEQELINNRAVNILLTEGEHLLKEISKQTAIYSSIIALLGSVISFHVYLFIGIKAYYSLFDISNLVLYCASFIQIINGIIKLANTFGKSHEICPLINYYFTIINTKSDTKYGNHEIDSNHIEIQFKNVSFKYPDSNKPTLNNITLTIHPGEHIAVVGENGSGKTTFIKLMCRLYDVTEGEILINGIDIKKYSKNSISKLYSIVFQDYKMFSLPLYQNVTIKKTYDQEKLYSCLESSNIKNMVLNLLQKEKTYIYKNIDKQGVDISGGEAQKLAFARSLYKDAPIVILDEPTASLDPIAENKMYQNFNNLVNNKTAIYISHRLSSCIFCDRIVVFDKGKIIEIGTHDELLKRTGKYKELWDAQSKYYN